MAERINVLNVPETKVEKVMRFKFDSGDLVPTEFTTKEEANKILETDNVVFVETDSWKIMRIIKTSDGTYLSCGLEKK